MSGDDVGVGLENVGLVLRAGLSVEERRKLAHELDPDRHPSADDYESMGAQLEATRRHAAALKAEVRRLSAEIAQLHSERSTLERALADLMTGREVAPADGGLAEVARLVKRPCARCGALVPGDQAVCETACEPPATRGGAS